MPEHSAIARDSCDDGSRFALFLGRLHPHKNPDLLLRAWARAARKHLSWKLVMAGPDVAGMKRDLQTLAGELGCADQVSFPGLVSGNQKARLLTDAAVLVLPSKSENFGNVVAESLAHGTPVIVTETTPWSGVTTRRCGWVVSAQEAQLAQALSEALGMSVELRAQMGARGRSWMAEAYSWESVATRMETFYECVLTEA